MATPTAGGTRCRSFRARGGAVEDLAGRTILVHTEQGARRRLVQMLRYLEPLAAPGRRRIIGGVDRALLPVVPPLPERNHGDARGGEGAALRRGQPGAPASRFLLWHHVRERARGRRVSPCGRGPRARQWRARVGPGGPERRVGVVCPSNLTYAQYRAVPFCRV